MLDVLENRPEMWKVALPRPSPNGHKYDRGHALVFAAPDLTGATRLAAGACSRIGAGLVTVLAEARDDAYRASLPADIMVETDRRKPRSGITSVLVGPGGGCPVGAVDLALDVVNPEAVLVLDAGAVTSWNRLGEAFSDRVLTPHEGEFANSFPHISGSREDRARMAAKESASVVVLKGAETVIATAGRVVVNTTASPYLAKAGTGDVLAGLITGLIAQGMNSFDAACAAVWLHGEIGRRIGPGLIPTDIIDGVPEVLGELLS